MKKLIRAACFTAVACLGSSLAHARALTLKAYVPTNPTAVPTKALTLFAENVNKAAAGKLNIQVFHSGQLGNDREAIESTRMGTIDIMFAGTGGYSSFYPKAKIFDLPFLFTNAKQVLRWSSRRRGDLQGSSRSTWCIWPPATTACATSARRTRRSTRSMTSRA